MILNYTTGKSLVFKLETNGRCNYGVTDFTIKQKDLKNKSKIMLYYYLSDKLSIRVPRENMHRQFRVNKKEQI